MIDTDANRRQKLLLDIKLNHFHGIMRQKFYANLHKGGPETWKHDTIASLITRLREEVEELEKAIYDGSGRDAVVAEAADVANFALIIADSVKPSESVERGYQDQLDMERPIGSLPSKIRDTPEWKAGMAMIQQMQSIQHTECVHGVIATKFCVECNSSDQRIDELEAENAKLVAENARLQEQVVALRDHMKLHHDSGWCGWGCSTCNLIRAAGADPKDKPRQPPQRFGCVEGEANDE